MMYEDKDGRVFLPEEVEELPIWKIENMGVHVVDEEPEMLVDLIHV